MAVQSRNVSFQQLADILRPKSTSIRNRFVTGLLLFALVCALVDILSEVLLRDHGAVQFVVETVSHGLTLLVILTLSFYLFSFLQPAATAQEPSIENLSANEDLAKIISSSDANPLLSPKRLLPLMIASIFIAETTVMFLLDNIGTLPPVTEAVIDSSILLLILSPTFFFLHYQPLKKHSQERLRIAHRLITSEERFQLALGAVKDSLWDYNPGTGSVYISPQCALMLGYTHAEDDNCLERWKSLLHPDDVAVFDEAFRSHMRGETENIRVESRVRSKNGEWIWMLTRGQTVNRDEQGRALRIIGTLVDVTQRKKAEADLLERKNQIRKLSHKLIHSAEAEKRRVAQDLHDEFGQVLTAFQLGLELLKDQRDMPDNEHARQCDRLLQMVQRLEAHLRNICDELTPTILDDLGLEETMRWHIKEFVRHDNAFSVEQKIVACQGLSRETMIVTYRIFQEALHNISKHAHATKVYIGLERLDDDVVLTVRDNGRGLNSEVRQGEKHNSWGLGLLGMRERATAIGGLLQIESQPGFGTMIRAVLPIQSGSDV